MPKNLLQALTGIEEKEKNNFSDTLSSKKDAVDPKKEVDNKVDNEKNKRKFFVMSSYGELLDIAIQLQLVEKEEVMFYVSEKEYSKIGEGIVDKCDNYTDYIGQGWTWVIDGCEQAKFQDWLREQGEYVVGTNQVMSELEDDRQKGQDWFKKAGFKQPESHNFTDIDDALDFVLSNTDRRWVLKQNGSAPKSINHVGKFDDSSDMIYHLEQLKKKWNEQEFGSFDCDLMEFVEGIEVAASAFFNGHDWLRDSAGKVIGFLNFEEKKECDGGMGETTGETGTTFYGCDETNKIFKDIMLRPEIVKVLKDSDYRGVFDINGSLTDDGFIAFEATSRFGIPATSYEFIEGLKSPLGDLLYAMACGEDTPIKIIKGWGMVVVITAKPYPLESDVEGEATSLGEKLWLLEKGKPVKEMTADHLKHIHIENFYRDEEGDYKVATKNGYLLVVSGTGDSVKDARKSLLEYIKENIYISGNKHRQDIGERVENNI